MATGELTALRRVTTEAGPVTLAPMETLRTRTAGLRRLVPEIRKEEAGLRQQAEDHLAEAGTVLLAHRDAWTIAAQQSQTVEKAQALLDRASADAEQESAEKAAEASKGLFARLSAHRQEQHLEHDRAAAIQRAHPLLVQLAQSAPVQTVPEADSIRAQAADLQAQADACMAQLRTASEEIAALEDEMKRRDAAEKAMGFDSLYRAAVLQTSGPEPVQSPLVLKRNEEAYLSISATLARIGTKTQYVGHSSGVSFPIGHTGIRYRVGSFRGEPIRQNILRHVDSGTLVLTNQRIAYVGATKATSIPLAKIMHVEVYTDGISMSKEGRENPDFFLTSQPKHVVFLLNWLLANQT